MAVGFAAIGEGGLVDGFVVCSFICLVSARARAMESTIGTNFIVGRDGVGWWFASGYRMRPNILFGAHPIQIVVEFASAISGFSFLSEVS